MLRFLLPLLVLSACTTAKKTTGVLAPHCGPTAIDIHDFERFGFTSPKNKVVVMRVFATWCPYCKEDLTALGELFRKGILRPENVEIMLLSYRNPKESKATYDKFLRGFAQYGIPLQSSQIIFIDKSYNELLQTTSTKGLPLFAGWQGVPFGLVFGKDGRLAFRGHFTTSPQYQDGHYAFIQDLTKEECSTR